MRKISLCISLAFLLFSCETEKTIDPATSFLKYYGMEEGDQEAVDMVVDSQGAIYLLGNHILTGNSDLYLVKVSPEGESLWETTITNTYRKLTARDIELGSDGNLIVLANVIENGEKDFLMLRVSAADGAELLRHQDGYAGFEEVAYSITEISDGYIVCGGTNKVLSASVVSEGFWFRFRNDFSAYGNTWLPQFTSNDTKFGLTEVVVKAIEARPGVFHMFGYSNRPKQLDEDFNFLVFALNEGGGTLGGTYQPGISRTNEKLSSIMVNKLGRGYFLTGISEDPVSGVSELFAVKIRDNIDGRQASFDDVIEQEKTITNFGFTTNSSANVIGYPASNSDYLLVSSENRTGNDNIYFTRLSSRLIANPDLPGLTFGGIGNDFGASVMEYGANNVLILGTMVLGDVNGQRKFVLMKLNKDGKFD